MKRVFWLTVLLISTYVFELLFLYPGNIVGEVNYYKPTSQISVTNTTVNNKDIEHYYKVVKQLKEEDFESLDRSITKNDGDLIEVYSQSIDFIISKVNIDILFHNFNKFKETNNGIKGIYVNGYYMNREAKMNSIKEILAKTNVNTLVIDAKTDNGHIMFDSQSFETDILKNERIKYDSKTLEELREIKDLYLIARIVVFQDPLFAKTFKEEAIFDSKNNRIYSQNEQYFLDPSSQLVKNYILELAVEACKLGFNEIQFDYIRYPDSNYQYMVFKEKNDYQNRINNINSFLGEAKNKLHNEGCLVSADIFGYILTNNEDGGIGQNLETIIDNVDFISPMVYPSHYSKGSFGYQNPNSHPYEVVSAALNDGLERGVPETQLRPFLQGFWHSIADVKENINAAEDKNLDWIIWNILSTYELDYFTKLES
tara:strand:+ start:418 stop:1698 length:1281 start_codon:yes stop_codon:yes gene_type:complete